MNQNGPFFKAPLKMKLPDQFARLLKFSQNKDGIVTEPV